MIIYTSYDLKLIETCNIYPNTDWTGKAEFIIDETNPNNQELINKIKEYAPYFDYVLDDNCNLIDVIKTQDKPVYEQEPSDIEILQEENKILKAKNQALSESVQFLEDCIVEMAEIVYA